MSPVSAITIRARSVAECVVLETGRGRGCITRQVDLLKDGVHFCETTAL